MVSCLMLYFGVAIPLLAAPSHPSGPEGRTFNDRTIRIQGKEQELVVTFAYPKPDEIIDWASNGRYVASNYSAVLSLRYDYKGYFWQGVFGRVGFDMIVVKPRPPDAVPWKDLNSLMMALRAHWIARNEATKNERSETRQLWMEPSLSQLNGTPCVQEHVTDGNDPNGELHYYFLIDEDHALDIVVKMVDNSTRPGLPKSDWRPRAEVFAAKLLATVRVRYMP